MTVPDPLRAAARTYPDRPALEAAGERRSYRELDRETEDVARRLGTLGVETGTRVALLLSRRGESLPAFHGVARSGGTLAPLSPRWTAVELADALEALRPGVLVCDRATEAAGMEAAGQAGFGAMPVVSLDSGGRAPSLNEVEEGESSSAGPDPDGVAAVLWTSGTAGGRRGVELTWRSVLHHVDAVGERLGLGADDRWYASLSPAHVGGLMLVLRAAATGSLLVVEGQFDPSTLARALDEGRATHVSLVPTMLQRLMEAREGRPAPESLECVLLGGAHTPWNLLDRALEGGYPVALTYGMTEAASQVATAPPELVQRKPGTVGPPLEGVEVGFAAREGTGGEGEGEVGEILVRGQTLARGYLGGKSPVDPEGWYHTGDLGRLDRDGDLWIVGRASSRIVTGGVTVDPREVEEALRSHPRVDDAVVVGLPDEEWGERVAAALVLSDTDEDELRRSLEAFLDPFLRERLSSAKRPRELRRIDGVPRNPGGKVDRQAVARLFQQAREEEGGG